DVMGFATFTTFVVTSQAVGRELSMRVYVPPGVEQAPILYLLHGRDSAPDDWLRRTHLLELLPPLPIAVACLVGENSFYTNLFDGQGNWEDSLLAEQIPAIERHFWVGGGRERRVIAGLSMGGFGAFKAALKRSEHFCAAYSTSGAFGATHDYVSPLKRRVFGPKGASPRQENDLFHLARQLTGPARPTLAFDCGTGDELLKDNQRFASLLSELGWNYCYTAYSGGHDWSYWDARMPELLAFASFHLQNGPP
ncbi:MAG: alpha/beta hydrolase, partial [Ardenticatenaceae bacterium]